jgi:hypothetical protein
VSIWLLEATFGIKMRRDGEIEFDQPKILDRRGMNVMPYISGFILPVIPLAILLPVHWVIIFLLNPFFFYIAGPFLTRAYLVRFAWGRGAGWDMLYCFIGGIITLMIGLIIRYHTGLLPWLTALRDRIM